MPDLDELTALQRCVAAFEGTNPEAHERMLTYLLSRFVDDPKIAEFITMATEFRDEARLARREGVNRRA